MKHHDIGLSKKWGEVFVLDCAPERNMLVHTQLKDSLLEACRKRAIPDNHETGFRGFPQNPGNSFHEELDTRFRHQPPHSQNNSFRRSLPSLVPWRGKEGSVHSIGDVEHLFLWCEPLSHPG